MKTEPSPLQTLQLITLAIMSGATLFLGVVIFIWFQKPTGGKIPGSDAKLFLAIVLGVYAAAVAGSGLIDRLREPRLAWPTPFQVYQTFHILRLALLEGAALFGLVSLMVHAPETDLRAHPWLLANLLPYLTLILVAALRFPTRERFDFLVKQAKENVR